MSIEYFLTNIFEKSDVKNIDIDLQWNVQDYFPSAPDEKK